MLYSFAEHRYLPSFPTRRSSDLIVVSAFHPRLERSTSSRGAEHDLPPIGVLDGDDDLVDGDQRGDRKSTRLNSSHVASSYAVFCLKKKKKTLNMQNNCINY